MKKILTLALALVLVMTALAGCSGKNEGGASGEKTPEELAELYTDAITENGGEMVEYNPVFTEIIEPDDMYSLIIENLGLLVEDMKAFGISASAMNVQAYGIAAVMPAEGKTDVVKEALQSYIDKQMNSFETYLADQYEIASNAKLDTLEDGTVLMVMCEDQDTVFDAISSAILEG